MVDKPEIPLTQPGRSQPLSAEAANALTTRGHWSATQPTDISQQRTRQMHLPQLDIITTLDPQADAQAARIEDRQNKLSSLTAEITKQRKQAEENSRLRAAGKPTNNTYDFQPANPDHSDIAPPRRPGDNPAVTPQTTDRPNKFNESNYPQAVEEAKRQNKPLVMVFGSPGCSHCVNMDRQAWPDQRVQQLLNDKAIFVHVNVNNAPELAQQYRISSYPTTIISRPGEQPMYRHSGEMSAGGLSNTLARYLK